MKHLAHRKEGGIPGDQQARRQKQIKPIGMPGQQGGMHLGHRELAEGEHRHHRQQHHDQQRLDEIGADHGPHSAEEGVDGGNTNHHHHSHVVIKA